MTSHEIIVASLVHLVAMASIDETATALGVTRRTVSDLIARGELVAVRMSPSKQGRVRIPKAAIVELLVRRSS